MPGKNKVAAYDGSQFKKEETDGTEPGLSEKLEDIEAKFQSVQVGFVYTLYTRISKLAL